MSPLLAIISQHALAVEAAHSFPLLLVRLCAATRPTDASNHIASSCNLVFFLCAQSRRIPRVSGVAVLLAVLLVLFLVLCKRNGAFRPGPRIIHHDKGSPYLQSRRGQEYLSNRIDDSPKVCSGLALNRQCTLTSDG